MRGQRKQLAHAVLAAVLLSACGDTTTAPSASGAPQFALAGAIMVQSLPAPLRHRDQPGRVHIRDVRGPEWHIPLLRVDRALHGPRDAAWHIGARAAQPQRGG